MGDANREREVEMRQIRLNFDETDEAIVCQLIALSQGKFLEVQVDNLGQQLQGVTIDQRVIEVKFLQLLPAFLDKLPTKWNVKTLSLPTSVSL